MKHILIQIPTHRLNIIRPIIFNDFHQIYLQLARIKQASSSSNLISCHIFIYLQPFHQFLMTNRTRYLVEDLKKTQQSFYQSQTSQNPEYSFLNLRKRQPSRLSKQRALAKHKYEDLTNMTLQKQRQTIWLEMQSPKKKKQWTHSYYQGNNKLAHASKTFSVYDNNLVEEFPDNNTKYNVQFLERSLYGQSLKFPRSQSGQFKKPSNRLYSKHYRPIVKDKVKFNENWELSASQFGKIWIDHKRDRIMNSYELQANPFKTPRSNSLISTMSRSQMY